MLLAKGPEDDSIEANAENQTQQFLNPFSGLSGRPRIFEWLRTTSAVMCRFVILVEHNHGKVNFSFYVFQIFCPLQLLFQRGSKALVQVCRSAKHIWKPSAGVAAEVKRIHPRSEKHTFSGASFLDF